MKGHVAGALRWHDFAFALGRWLRHGDATVARFSNALAASLGVASEALQVFGSGRAALHAFVASLGLGPQDEVLLPGYTCVVVPNVFMHLGLPVRYVDIAAGQFNCTAEAFAATIGSRTRLALVPHNFGLVMAGLPQLRQRFPDVIFVEDVAHAWGSRDAQGRVAGSLGHAAFFSFEYSKCLSTGLGGALLINEPTLRERFATHRPAFAAVARQVLTLAWHRLTLTLPGGALRAVQTMLRAPSRALGLVAQTPASELSGASQPDYACGLHPLSAALGLQQLGRAETVWRLRQQQAARYDELLSGSTLLRPVARDPGAVLLRYPVRVTPTQREPVMRALEALDIVPGSWFDDVVHPVGSFRYGYIEGECPQGEAAALSVLNLPLGLHARLNTAQAAGLRALAQGQTPMSSRLRLAHVGKLATASALAQVIPMAAAPLLTRWYSAAELGQWALFVALAANLATVACARLEYAIVLPRRVAEAALLLRLCLGVAVAVGLLCTLGVGVALLFETHLGPLRPLGAWLWGLPLVVMLGGVFQALTLWNNRQQGFGRIAQARVLQQAGATALQLAGHAGGLAALLFSQLLGAVLGPLWLWLGLWRRDVRTLSGNAGVGELRLPRRATLWRLARRYKQFPLINSPHAFVNALQETMVIAMIAALASPAAAGYYAIMVRLVKAPASLVGGALSEVLLGELARGWQVGADLRPRLRKAIRWLALAALPPAAILLAWAPQIFGRVLGEPWAEAGHYARWLTPYVWAHFITAPLTVAPMVTGRQAGALMFSVVGNLIYIGAVALALVLGGELKWALAAISVVMPLYFGGYLAWLVHGSVRKTA